jgi:hypothetical protein
MASLKEIFEKAQKTGKVEYTFFGGGSNVSPFNQTSIPFTEGNNNTLSSKPPYIRLGYEGSFPGNEQFRTDDPTNTYNTLLASTRDTARIGAFFTDYPNGPLWLSKQGVLQLTNPDTSYKTAEGRVTLGDKLSQLEGPRFYNPLGTNTLAQVASNALGLHFTRHGLSPTNETGYLSLNTVETTGKIQSRLELYKLKLNDFNETVLNKYLAGPNSTFGIGITQTNVYKDSFGLNTGVTNKKPRGDNNETSAQNLGFLPWNYVTIDSYGSTETKNPLITPPIATFDVSNPLASISTNVKNQSKYPLDFRKLYNEGKDGAGGPWSDYPKYNIHSRIGVTTPSNPKNVVGPIASVDSINVLTITPSNIFYTNANSARNKIPGGKYIYTGRYDSQEVLSKTNGYYARDIIKFNIELLNNNEPVVGNAINTDVLAFRAYLGDFSDDITPTWKTFNYMGRGEDFYVYEKFSRSINFSFYLFAHSAQEMPAIYTKLNYLMSSMAPDYNESNQMRGTYAYLTIGDYIYRQPGVFTKMNISDLLTAPWEIALEEPENRRNQIGRDAVQHEVPKYMKVTMGFNVIHNFLPRKNKRNQPHRATFVTPNWVIGAPNYYLPQGTNPPLRNPLPNIDVPPNIPVIGPINKQ